MAKRGPYAKGNERREEILSSAISVIAERGFHGATLRAVGRELGLEPAHILYYFGSREGLLRAVIERWDQGNDPGPENPDVLDALTLAMHRNRRIRGVVQLYLAFAIEAVQEGHPAREYFQERFRLAAFGIAETIRNGQSRGDIRADISPERAARRLIALSDGLQLQWLFDDTVDAVGEVEEAIDELFVCDARRKVPELG